MFQYDKIYYGRYNCVTNPTIYDQNPLFIILELKGNGTCIACNLHWIGSSLRSRFIQVLIEMRKKCINESMFRLLYRTIKYNPQLSFALCSIRKYYLRNMTNVKEVPSEQWGYLTNLTASLYRARYLQKNVMNTSHIIQRKRVNPSVAPRFPNYPNYPKAPQVT